MKKKSVLFNLVLVSFLFCLLISNANAYTILSTETYREAGGDTSVFWWGNSGTYIDTFEGNDLQGDPIDIIANMQGIVDDYLGSIGIMVTNYVTDVNIGYVQTKDEIGTPMPDLGTFEPIYENFSEGASGTWDLFGTIDDPLDPVSDPLVDTSDPINMIDIYVVKGSTSYAVYYMAGGQQWGEWNIGDLAIQFDKDGEPKYDTVSGFSHFTGYTTGGAPVPEPATMLLLGTGLIGLAGLGRKRFLKQFFYSERFVEAGDMMSPASFFGKSDTTCSSDG